MNNKDQNFHKSEKTKKINTKALDSLLGLVEQKNIIFGHAVVAVEDNLAFPSTLLIGNSGCGKTSLARLICDLCGTKFREVHGRTLSQDKSFFKNTIRLLHDTEEKLHLFVDEVHQLSANQQEIFFPILDNHNITIIAATTDTGKLIEPFQNRFRLRLTIQKYTEKEIYEIAKWYCKNKKIIATPSALKKIAGHGRNTPRIVFSLVDSCYSKSRFMAICASKISGEDKDSTTMITDEIVDMTFDDLNLHTYGIEKQEISILSSIRTHTNLSLYTICAITKVDQKQYLQFYEPHLLDLGFITKTSKGRSLTEKGKAFVDSISS